MRWVSTPYLYGTVTNAPLAMSFDNLNVGTPGGGPPPNQPPTADFTSTSSGLTLNVIATANDTDGNVASYDWDWGDGTAHGTGASTSHPYATAGTKTVTLTVTDDDGAETEVVKQVTVSTGGAQVVAADAFGRSATGGWGTADTGGAWTVSGQPARFTVAGAGVSTRRPRRARGTSPT